MKILAIETSCDETAIALVEASGGLKAPKFRILKNIVSSQTAIHAHWGGVVPNLAKREHLKNLPIIFKRIMNHELGIKRTKAIIHNSKFVIPDLIAVTVGPGLEPALWAGINFTKEIHKKYFPKAKLIGVNHLEGHLYSFLLAKKTGISNSQFLISKTFPAVSLIVSGGHTILLLMKSMTKWKKLGETRDDAAGEAFDKVARMLGLPYPGGPALEKLTLSLPKGQKPLISFPRPMIDQKNYDFSFSGLKTSVLYYLRDANPRMQANLRKGSFVNSNKFVVSHRLQAEVAASFEQAAIDVLVFKTLRAAKEFGAKSIMLSGGVAANKRLRKELSSASRRSGLNFFTAPLKFNTDNAAMIAAAAYINHLQKKNRRLIAQANLNL